MAGRGKDDDDRTDLGGRHGFGQGSGHGSGQGSGQGRGGQNPFGQQQSPFPAPPARPSRPEARGLRHLAFRVAALDPAIAHLQAQGVACEPVRVDEYTGRRFTFFADPDDLPLELYESG